ncbi:MAG TPA: hypothetical protein VLV55_11840 [Rhizomicrobium sp.]|nr:hypothetical protein [Rhizomicrobium sp.]
MRSKLIAAALAASFAYAGSAMAQNGAGTTTGGGVCLWQYQIDHTNYVAPQTILFHMKDGRVWRNTLKGPCPGLKYNGFAYVTHTDQICSNVVPIRVLQTGEVCALGEFTAYSAPPHA